MSHAVIDPGKNKQYSGGIAEPKFEFGQTMKRFTDIFSTEGNKKGKEYNRHRRPAAVYQRQHKVIVAFHRQRNQRTEK